MSISRRWLAEVATYARGVPGLVADRLVGCVWRSLPGDGVYDVAGFEHVEQGVHVDAVSVAAAWTISG